MLTDKTAHERLALEDALARFERAWQSDLPPRIEEYLADTPVDRRQLLVELICTDLELRLKAGQTARVEEYLVRFPELRQHPRDVTELAFVEFTQRRSEGQMPRIEEYLQRFPEQGAELSERLPKLMPENVPAVGDMSPLSSPRAIDAQRTDRGAPPESPLLPSPKTPPSDKDWPRVPGFEILSELGKGGMGIVYKARHHKLGHIVALKMIRAGGHADEHDLARFKADAEALAHLKHDNIVRLFEFGQFQGLPYFTLELMDGGSLAENIKKDPQQPKVAARIVEQVARGIAQAHECGVVHRDLKPANILLAADGTPKITDFGLVKRVDDGSGITITHQILGTPPYMAPEQAKGHSRHVGPAADVYGLGAVLYECLTGRPPFKAPSVAETLDLVLSQDPVPPRRLQPKVPRDLQTICLKCLRKEPDRRYASAADLAEDLRRFQAGEPILARPVRAPERLLKWVRRRPALATACLTSFVAVLALLAGSGYFLYRQNQDQLSKEYLRGRQEAQHKQVAELYEEALQLAQTNEQVGKEDWQPALGKLAQAQGRIGDEADDSELSELQSKIGQLQSYIKGRKKFADLSDEAHYLANLLPEGTVATRSAHAKKTRDAVDGALAVYNIKLSNPGGEPTFGPLIVSEAGRKQVADACYELVLILAETAIYGQADPKFGATQALLLLDKVAESSDKYKSYHLRRERYLKIKGEPVAAAMEKDHADRIPAKTALDHFLVGQEFRHRGNYVAARNSYKRALEKNANLFWANYYLAVSYHQIKEHAAALAHLTACVTLKKESPWPYLMRGIVQATLADFDAADDDFEMAERKEIDERKEKEYPDSLARYVLYTDRGYAWMLRGWHFHEQFKKHQQKTNPDLSALQQAKTWYDKAEQQMTQAMAASPGAYQAYVNLADLHQKRAELPKIAPDASEEHLSKALTMLNKAISLYPDAELYRSRAKLLTRFHQYTAALADLDEAVRLTSQGESKSVAIDLIQKAQLLDRSQEHWPALRALTDAVKNDPSQLEAYRLQGKVLLELKRYSESEANFDKYLRRGGKPLAKFYLARGLARAKQNKWDGAVRDFTEALELERLDNMNDSKWHPDPELLRYRGWAYLILNCPALAVLDFNWALKTNPKDADALNGRGLAFAGLGKWQLALTDVDSALKVGVGNDHLLYFKAARTVALCAGHPTGKTKAAMQEQKLALESRALDLLEHALSLVPQEDRTRFWKDYVSDDAALNSLQHKSAYWKLAKANSAAP